MDPLLARGVSALLSGSTNSSDQVCRLTASGRERTGGEERDPNNQKIILKTRSPANITQGATAPLNKYTTRCGVHFRKRRMAVRSTWVRSGCHTCHVPPAHPHEQLVQTPERGHAGIADVRQSGAPPGRGLLDEPPRDQTSRRTRYTDHPQSGTKNGHHVGKYWTAPGEERKERRWRTLPCSQPRVSSATRMVQLGGVSSPR
jgi:hypothetical protein